VEVVASLSQGRTAAAQCGLFTYKSVPVIFEPPCTIHVQQPSVDIITASLSNICFSNTAGSATVSLIWFYR